MMEEMNKWLSAHKKLCVITGIFGLLVSPFLWPIFLAVIIQSLSLVIPVAAGLFFYEKYIILWMILFCRTEFCFLNERTT